MSQDPIGFNAGDANLYRYVGNGPVDSTDPSGLQEPLPPFVHPWEDFPGYSPDAGPLNPNGGNNSGNATMYDWLRNDPSKAQAWFEKIQNAWGGIVSQAAKANDVPEALIWSSIFAEMVNFGWADYNNLGSSLGPGQLTKASKSYYGCPARWDEHPNGIGMSRGGIFIKQLHSLDELGQLDLPNMGGADVNLLAQDIYYLAWILHMQAMEIRLAASGGGKLPVPGGGTINVPAMDPNFINGSQFPFGDWFKSPGVGNNFHYNLPRLSVLMIMMNRENPGATGNGKPPLYAYPFSFRGPQSSFAYYMFDNGYFSCESGKLKNDAGR